MKAKQTNQPKRNNKTNNKAKNNNNLANSKLVAVPIAAARVSKNQQPVILRKSKDEILVSHREYVTEVSINTTNNFPDTVKKLSFNPGLSLTFPWLSNIATSYESYRFEKVSIHFETSLPTTTQGAFIMAFDYDASDESPANKSDFLNYDGAVKGPIWSSDLVMSLNAKRLNKLGPSRYVRGGVRSDTDIKTYDAGNLFYTLINAPSDNSLSSIPLGDLFVEYTVLLQTPQINTIESTIDSSFECFCPDFDTNATCFDGSTVKGGLPISCNNGDMTFSAPGRYLITTLLKSVNASSPSVNWYSGNGNISIDDFGTWTASVGNSYSAARAQLLTVHKPNSVLGTLFSNIGTGSNATITISKFAI